MRIITLNDGAALIDYAKPIVIEFRASMVRVEAGVFIIRLHHGGPQGAKPKGEVVVDILRAIKERQT